MAYDPKTRKHRFNPWVDTHKSREDYTPLDEREDWDVEVEVLPTGFDFEGPHLTLVKANKKPWRGDF